MEFLPLASGSSGNCYLLSDQGGSVLIEAGIPWKRVQLAMNFQTWRIRFCLVSHGHGDHAGFIRDVLRAGIDCWGPEEIGIKHHRFMPVEKEVGGVYIYPGWSIKAFPCVHNVPCLGYLISHQRSKVLYIPDTMYSPFRFGPGITHFLLSVNYSKETISPDINPAHRKHVIQDHMSLETAKELLKANDLSTVREIHLLHLSRDNSDSEYFKSEVEKLTGKPVYIA